jgi:hypothetical protein
VWEISHTHLFSRPRPLFGYAVQIDGGSTLGSNFRGVGNFHLAPLNQAIVDDTTADLLKLSLHFDSEIDAMTVVSTDISTASSRLGNTSMARCRQG